MSHCISCICFALDLFLKQNVLFPTYHLFLHIRLNRTMQFTEKIDIFIKHFSFLKYTTYITLIFFKKSIVDCTMYLQPFCWHQISKDTLHSQNAKREECFFNMYTLHTFIYR